MTSLNDAVARHTAARQARHQATTVELEAEDAMIAAAWQAWNERGIDGRGLLALCEEIRNSEIAG
ncbi:hypothetical protein [Lentzea sp. NPDC004782]|uniref:hypothetical protein n=1 Tax=Lentzea sp. NPDC004782 TaxID=3154458 RepID=UPI0033AB586E